MNYLSIRNEPFAPHRVCGYLFAALAVAFLLLFPTAAAHAESDDKTLTDEKVADVVEREYLFDSAVPYDDIDVRVTDGIVTLEGMTNNVLAKDRAGLIAETVKGVRSVINRIKVKPSGDISGSKLAGEIESALLNDPATDSYEVVVKAEDSGKVTLDGKVDSWAERNLSEIVAKGVRGVTSVQNNITIRYEEELRANSEIKAEIEKRLDWDILVDNVLIEVAVQNGEVTLTGTVGSAAEKRRAQSNAWVSGVKSVNIEGLDVERWARDDDLRENKFWPKPDIEIRDALSDAFLYDPRVLSFNIHPDVSSGWVTLRGMVDNLAAKNAAERVARHTVGVTGVTNRLKIRTGDQLSDPEIQDNVEQKVGASPYLEPHEIEVDVYYSNAYLRGTVDSYFEKSRAEALAYSAKGVKNVKNQLVVSDATSTADYNPYVFPYHPYPWTRNPEYRQQSAVGTADYAKSDERLEKEIESELFWSPFVDADQVNVTVNNGRAILTGKVDSSREWDAAMENAFEGGAYAVDNDLVVKAD